MQGTPESIINASKNINNRLPETYANLSQRVFDIIKDSEYHDRFENFKMIHGFEEKKFTIKERKLLTRLADRLETAIVENDYSRANNTFLYMTYLIKDEKKRKSPVLDNLLDRISITIQTGLMKVS